MKPPYPLEITALEPPLPLRISNVLLWGGMDIFWNHTINIHSSCKFLPEMKLLLSVELK